jgi:hypothetical protein
MIVGGINNISGENILQVTVILVQLHAGGTGGPGGGGLIGGNGGIGEGPHIEVREGQGGGL